VDLAAVRSELEGRRTDLRGQLSALTATPRDPMTAVSYGKRIGDGTTEAVERINQTGTARHIAAMLGDVERALDKLDDGTYGVCDRCGSSIGEERLAARPWSVLCLSCSASS